MRSYMKFMVFAAVAKVSIDDLERKCTDIVAQCRAIQDLADDAGRDLTEEEEKQVKDLFEAHKKTKAEIERRRQLAALEMGTGAGTGRKTKPMDGGMPIPDDARIEGGEQNGARPGTCGFTSLGEFAVKVKDACRGGAHIDSRIQRIMSAAPGSPAQEGVGADGGYLVPPEFRTDIKQKLFGSESVISRTDIQTTTSNSITFPIDETAPWDPNSGAQAYWEGEGQLINQSKPSLGTTTVRAHKLAALIPVSDEQLEDGPSLETFLRRKIMEKMSWKINDAIINGDGVGKPKGLLLAGCKITVPAEAAQPTNTIVFANVEKMWSRCYAPNRINAVWLYNQEIEPQLSSLVAPGVTPTLPVFLPPGGLSAAPYGTLKGRPCVPNEACAALGTEGDLILVDLSSYLSLQKNGGQIKSDVSMHLWFDYGLQAFRFTTRLGGQPWWSTPITPPKSANTRSMIITLATRP